MVLLRKSFISIKKHIKKPYPCETKFHDFFRNHWTHVDSEITKTKSLVARSRIANNGCPHCLSCIEYLGPQTPTVTTMWCCFSGFFPPFVFSLSLKMVKKTYIIWHVQLHVFPKNGWQTFFFWRIQISATFRCLNRENLHHPKGQ